MSTYLDDEALAAYAYLMNRDMANVEDWQCDAEEAYQGVYNSDEDFAQNLADDLGLIPSEYSWPASCIDWDQAARELMMDYMEHDGYYFRQM